MSSTREVAEEIAREFARVRFVSVSADALLDLTAKIDSALQHREQEVRAEAWLPIESAPRDSSWILALARTGRQFVVRWGGGAWEDDNRLCRDPVYWRPLPPPPAIRRDDTPQEGEGRQ